MNTGNRKKEAFERRRLWQGHIDNWRKSGLTQKEYCQQNDIKVHRFTTWKKRLSKPGTQLSFIQLQMGSSTLPVPLERPRIRLHTPNGFQIDIVRGFDPATLKELILTVQSL